MWAILSPMPRFLRFYCPELQSRPGAVVEFPEGEARHAITVLRRPVGSTVTLFDGAGLSATAKITTATRRGVQAELRAEAVQAPEPPRLTIALSVPKAGLEDVLPMLAELGATDLLLLASELGDVVFREAHGERYQRLAIAAAKQCGSDWLIRVGGPIAFADALKMPSAVLCDPSGESGVTLPTEPVILIGPEGGWSDAELAAASKVPHWRLPGHVLRTGTASVVAAALAVAARS